MRFSFLVAILALSGAEAAAAQPAPAASSAPAADPAKPNGRLHMRNFLVYGRKLS